MIQKLTITFSDVLAFVCNDKKEVSDDRSINKSIGI